MAGKAAGTDHLQNLPYHRRVGRRPTKSESAAVGAEGRPRAPAPDRGQRGDLRATPPRTSPRAPREVPHHRRRPPLDELESSHRGPQEGAVSSITGRGHGPYTDRGRATPGVDLHPPPAEGVGRTREGDGRLSSRR